MKILLKLTFLQVRKKPYSLRMTTLQKVMSICCITSCLFLTQPTSIEGREESNKFIKENLQLLTQKDHYKRYLKHPIFKSKAFNKASDKKKKEIRRKIFLQSKYDPWQRRQLVIFIKSIVGMTLVVFFMIFFPLMRYLATHDPDAFWNVVEKSGWVKKRSYLKEMRLFIFFGESLGGFARFFLNSSYFFNIEKEKYFFHIDDTEPDLNGDLAAFARDLQKKQSIVAIQNCMSIAESLMFYIIFKFVLGVPETWSKSIVLLAWPLISVPFFLVYFLYYYYTSKIKNPFLFFWNKKNLLFVDSMESLELRYIDKQHELSEMLQNDIIEPMLFDARRFPEKRAYLKEFIEEVLYLPNSNKTKKMITKLPKKPDLSAFQDYPEKIRKEVRLLYHRSREGRKGEAMLLIGPTGVGKTHFTKAISDLINAEIATLSLAGNTRKDIMGEAGTGKDPGELGFLAEALSNATKRAIENGKDSIILFLEEGGQALQSKNKEQIEQLLLELLEPSTTSFKSPALGDYDIPLPTIIIMTSNHAIEEGALDNRTTKIIMKKVEWDVKKRILKRKRNMAKYCRKVKFDPNNLTEEHEKAIDQILDEMEKEDPKAEKYPGLRQPILRIQKYLEDIQYEEEFEEMKKKFTKKKTTPNKSSRSSSEEESDLPLFFFFY